MDREKLLKKIEALLAMADPDRGGSEAEREKALSQAVKLMEIHHLEMKDIKSIKNGFEHRTYPIYIKNKFEVKEWRRVLARGVAEAFFCTPYKVGSDQVMIVGTSTDIDVFEQVWRSLVNQLQLACDLGAKEALKTGHIVVHGKGALDPVAWRKTFLETATGVLLERLKKMRSTTEQVNAIVLVSKQDAEEYMSAAGFKVGNSITKWKGGHQSKDAMQNGAKAGEQAHITMGLESSESRKELE